jgi:peptidyl-prolyl cis-trans isomerase D
LFIFNDLTSVNTFNDNPNMALIGKIRQNGWILISVMVLALGGFIFMDIMSNVQNYKSGDANTAGKVGGTTIERNTLDQTDKLLFADRGQDPYQTRQLAWNYLVEKALIEKEATKMGLGVGPDELKQLLFGPENLSQVIQQKYKNQQTGQVDFTQLQQIKGAIEGGQELNPQFRGFWSATIDEVIKDRLQRKMLNCAFKGIGAPNWLAEDFYAEQNTKGDFLFVKVPYEKVSDDEAKVSDEDYKAFYAESKESFRTTEELRFVEFAALDVKPTAADSVAVRDGLNKKLEGFRSAPNDSLYCIANGGYYNPSNYFKKIELEGAADMILNQPVGTVVGPYFADAKREYRIAKIIDKRAMPDSVKARHILIQAKNEAEFAQAGKTIDSLKLAIESGRARFDSTAVRFSQDGSSVKGGDLGYFVPGQMVPEFNAICCYTGTIGKLYKVKTQFGYHLIDITNRKYGKEVGVQLAYIASAMEPSDATQAVAKDRAAMLISKSKNGDELKKNMVEAGLTSMSSPAIRSAEYSSGFVNALGSADAVRDIQRWLFGKDVKAGSVAPDVFAIRDPAGGFYDAKYVVASVKSVLPKGLPDWSGLKPQMETAVKNRKKAAAIKSKINNSTDLAAIAGQFGVAIDTARLASFATAQIGKVGQEPKVNGVFAKLNAGQTSAPIDGTAGVFVIQMIQKSPVIAPLDLTMFKKQAIGRAVYDVNNGLMNSIRKNADVTDFRSNFY